MVFNKTILSFACALWAGVACAGRVTASASSPTVVGEAAPVAADRPGKAVSRPARITSATTYYDRKEGVAILTGNVFVDDERYKLHADKAYVFTNGTNDLERIVAIGNIALTNDNRRAYGGKVAYYRNRGMVVLHSDAGRPAEVREVKPGGDQIVRGRKIKFWIDSEQVEVIESVIDAPADLKGADLKSLR